MLLWNNVCKFRLAHLLSGPEPQRNLFESARSALFFALKTIQKRKVINTVYVCDFTCKAVLDAISPTNLDIQIYTLDENFCANLEFLDGRDLDDSIFIIQATFGKLALNLEQIEKLKAKGAIIIIDAALSAGTTGTNFEKCLNSSDAVIYSYECSKAFSYGWGGELVDFTDGQYFESAYANINNESIYIGSDILRLIQTIYSTIFLKSDMKLANFIRKVLTILKLFRRSANSSDPKVLGKKVGPLTRRWIENTSQIQRMHYNKTQRIFFDVHNIVLKNIDQNIYVHTDKIVSPRYPVILERSKVAEFVSSFAKYKIPIGFWFTYSPFDDQRLAFGPLKDKVCVNIPICDRLDLNNLRQALEDFCNENN